MCESQPCPASSNLAARCKASFLRGLELGTPRRPTLIIKLAAPTRPGPSVAVREGGGGGRVGPGDPSLGKDALGELPHEGRTMGASGRAGPGSRFLGGAGRAPGRPRPPRPSPPAVSRSHCRPQPSSRALRPGPPRAPPPRASFPSPGCPSFLRLRHRGAAFGDSSFRCGRLPAISLIYFLNFSFFFGSGWDVSLPP